MAEYLDIEQQRTIEALKTRFAHRTEWPTWLLIAGIYGGWLAVLLLVRARHLPLLAATPLLIVLGAWHMSLQHELIHGHPTRWQRVNELLGYLPLTIWYPYAIYRDTHLQHHHDADLTLPGIDPESNYVTRQHWDAMPRWQRALWSARKTFAGRILVGPPMSVAMMFVDTFETWRHGDGRYAPVWALHVLIVVAMLAWLQLWIGIPWWYYLVAVTWPALSLAMIRSLYEHRAAPHPRARTTINEAGWVMRLLYLNLNYHLVHHDLPGLPWYELPHAWRMRREAYAQECGGFVIHGGYRELWQRYAWRPTDTPVHPA
jgi:fatty acid desaturase